MPHILSRLSQRLVVEKAGHDERELLCITDSVDDVR